MAPFDKIIVTCSPESVPKPLVEQLREGGRMVIPVGERFQQTLYRMTKQDGKLIREPLRPTLFVPMTGEAEDQREHLPDGTNPKVVNGDFTTANTDDDRAKTDFVPGWYYGRQVQQMNAGKDSTSPQQNALVRFRNDTPGLSSHLLQGIAVEGKKVSMIRLSGKVRTENVRKGPTSDAMPAIAISFYDVQRQELGTYLIGPFRGTRPWRSASRLIRVPAETNESILRIGLFGATGIADFGDISIEKVD
jgi:protein-L-isoaspartate(D-aspartate) O-methyltransferase